MSPLLPIEMIDEILTHVDWETFMSFRMTGRLGKFLTDGARHQDRLHEAIIKRRLKDSLTDFAREFAPQANKESILNPIVDEIFSHSADLITGDIQMMHKDELIYETTNVICKHSDPSFDVIDPSNHRISLKDLKNDSIKEAIENFSDRYSKELGIRVSKKRKLHISEILEIVIMTVLRKIWIL